MKTHPDAVGSDRLLEKYLGFSSYYEEARRVLSERDASPSDSGTARESPTPRGGPARRASTPEASPKGASSREAELEAGEDHRLAYYQVLQRLERIDKPYTFHRNEKLRTIRQLKAEARLHFTRWNGWNADLYARADREYDRLKAEKVSGPYMKDALAINVSPVFHNIVAYHLTGMTFYRKQVKQNLDAVLQKLVDHDCGSLRLFIQLLIQDMWAGPAVFGQGSRRRWTPLEWMPPGQ